MTERPGPLPVRKSPRVRLRRRLDRLGKNSHLFAGLALSAVCLFSIGSRSLFLDQPCSRPCSAPASYGLIFDERYYVNAARRIDGRPVPHDQPYAKAPAHKDPNAEHPQLAKLVIAAGIAVFGDRPLGWRIGSLVFGTAALLGIFFLVVSAGGSWWLGVGAAGLMSADNLFVVHGRIATLDIYTVSVMLFAAALYVRKSYVASGAVLAVAACMKLVAFYEVFTFGLIEALSVAVVLRQRRQLSAEGPGGHVTGDQARGLAKTVAVAATAYALLLWVLDRTVPAYDTGPRTTLRDPYHHTRHMIDYATNLVRHGAGGIASYPWQWLLNEKTINYFTVVRTTSDGAHGVVHTTVIAFSGVMNPFIIFMAIPALALTIHGVYTRGKQIDTVALAWVLGIFLPLTLQSIAQHRTMYLYYMLLILPGIYVSIARMFAPPRFPLLARVAYAAVVLAGFVQLYPFRTLSGF